MGREAEGMGLCPHVTFFARRPCHGLFILNITWHLFESALENSGAIWQITLTVNKNLIKLMNWQWLRHALVMLLTIALFILSTLRRNFDDHDGRPSAEEHPRLQVNRVQIRAIRWTKCLAQWTAGSHAASFCVSGGVRGAPSLQWPTASSHLHVG